MMTSMNGAPLRHYNRKAAARDDEDEEFFETNRRAFSVHLKKDFSDSDEDDADFQDSRMSFASIAGPPTYKPCPSFAPINRPAFLPMRLSVASISDCNFWIDEPMAINDRRKRLFRGMGLSIAGANSMKDCEKTEPAVESQPSPIAEDTKTPEEEQEEATRASKPQTNNESASSLPDLPSPTFNRTKSDTGAIALVAEVRVKKQREQVLGPLPHRCLSRSWSVPTSMRDVQTVSIAGISGEKIQKIARMNRKHTAARLRNAPSGKCSEQECKEDGEAKEAADAETGQQMTVEELEKSPGYSPIVKEVMKRVSVDGFIKGIPPSLTKTIKTSKKKGGNWLKNIKGVTNSVSAMKGEKEKEKEKLKEREPAVEGSIREQGSRMVKVHQQGKPLKELTGLYLCQEIQAHEGSIWTIKFSLDSRYLASAGEDRVILVWEVRQIPGKDEAVMSLVRQGDNRPTDQAPIPLARPPMDKKRRGKITAHNQKNSSSIPENIVVPDNVFSLSEAPVCSLQGHLDDVLDLSWSKSQQLLSSSMDKTVRLWDIETKSCIKVFTHSDYVTCIQFNPVDDRYFISGSLDAKVRIWSIPNRKVVDWVDLHEMVTAACYTPDGKGALIGSHKGICHWYNTTDCMLIRKDQVDIQAKKKTTTKPTPKKITGFQFAPENPSDVMVTSADSQIRVFEGLDVIHKFKGFKNTSSQISASFTADGRHVICASEDSQVFVWMCDESISAPGGKRSKTSISTKANEHFQCKEVSVAIPWPCAICKNEQPQKTPDKSKGKTKDKTHKHSNTPKTTSDSNAPNLPENDKTNKHKSQGTKKNASEQAGSSQEKGKHSRSGSGGGSTPSKAGLISSIQSSMQGAWPWNDGSSHGSRSVTAWGLVIVTAGLGGEIRTYQNFGQPRRVNRQPGLF